MPAASFSEPMEINTISFDPVPGLGTQVILDAVSIDMGYCTADQLDPVFDSNYVSGSKIRVFERTSAFTLNASTPWTPIALDTPFYFNPSWGNLVIEINWPNGSQQIYTFNYATSGVSLISGSYGAGSGDAYTEAAHLLLEGNLALNQMTFAGIKATFQ